MTMDPSVARGRLSGEAVIPLTTLDPAAALDDLGWLEEAVGDARVVAIGESAHYNREFYQLRHRLLRYLAERHGFGAYAMETGFAEGWLADGWVRAGEDEGLGHVMANGMTSLMGLWTPMRDHLEWMREHNRTAARPVGFYGIDMPGSMASLLPGLDAVLAYLAEADPEYQADPAIRDTAAAFAQTSAFSLPALVSAYAGLAPERRDALTAGLAELASRMTARRLEYRGRTTAGAHDRASRSMDVTVTLDTMLRAMPRGDRQEVMLQREAALADTVEWILGREDRVVLAAHNAHVQRWPASLPGMSPVTMMGMHLAERLGEDYLVIGTTSGTGQTLNGAPSFYAGELFTDLADAPPPGSLDALMAASHDGLFATDLRGLSASDAATVKAVTSQRHGVYHSELNPLDAYDILVHVPHVTAAEPDQAALACAPAGVREPFAGWAKRAG
ncbi:erythromycin esterase family protein [Sphaerisporangium aureirubrum]|uniref:Erythromycin esterase family protein n=1 Tax=Sphaerisporangium aureirubrum TaxID=1544736 RepID=A0ABW1NIQ9_9ACTN